MTEPIEPTVRTERRAGERRSRSRRQSERRASQTAANLPVPAAPSRAEAKREAKAEPAREASAFTAQLLGQPGQKRGLKGGPPVLEAARAAYLEAEWSGPADRRKPSGRITKTEL
jgi:hypothetical protein